MIKPYCKYIAVTDKKVIRRSNVSETFKVQFFEALPAIHKNSKRYDSIAIHRRNIFRTLLNI